MAWEGWGGGANATVSFFPEDNRLRANPQGTKSENTTFEEINFLKFDFFKS